MPLLRAGDVRVSNVCKPKPAPKGCLNALVAGGRCAGTASDDVRGGGLSVSMPLLRAGDVRALNVPRHAREIGIVSMPLLRAGDVRAYNGTRGGYEGGRVSMPLLRAGDVRVSAP